MANICENRTGKIVVMNCGSSSAKGSVYERTRDGLVLRFNGLIDRVGHANSVFKMTYPREEKIEIAALSQEAAINIMFNFMKGGDSPAIGDSSEVCGIGHRVVHGGTKYTNSILVDSDVIAGIRQFEELAPLHNPPNRTGIEIMGNLLPGVPQVAVFDTAFHQTMPESSYLYNIPPELNTKFGIRRWGFHGTSHLYVSRVAAVLLGADPASVNLVTAHIGNGTSLTMVRDGKSFDTSMGLTPLAGVMMGTRSGDIDPAVVLYLLGKGYTPQQIDNLLNKQSGLLAIAGIGKSDRRDIDTAAEAGNTRCQLAQWMEAEDLRQYIGGYMFRLGKVDGLVFTAGAGENNNILRRNILKDTERFGLVIDHARNDLAIRKKGCFQITTDKSPIPAFVISTDEEGVIANDVAGITDGTFGSGFKYPFELPGSATLIR